MRGLFTWLASDAHTTATVLAAAAETSPDPTLLVLDVSKIQSCWHSLLALLTKFNKNTEQKQTIVKQTMGSSESKIASNAPEVEEEQDFDVESFSFESSSTHTDSDSDLSLSSEEDVSSDKSKKVRH